MTKFKERWSKGKTGGCVVSDTPNCHTRNDSVYYYGGHLIAESIPKEEYVNLIAATPDLFAACERVINEVEFWCEGGIEPPWARQVRAALAKARGESGGQDD